MFSHSASIQSLLIHRATAAAVLRASRRQTPSRFSLCQLYTSESNKKSWLPESDEQLQKVTTQAMIHDVSEQQRAQAGKVVPWFLRNMPSSYFKQVQSELQSKHVQAITTMKELMGSSDLTLRMVSRTEDNSEDQITFISNSVQPGTLYKQISGVQVPPQQVLSSVSVFTTLDNEMSLNIFSIADQEPLRSAQRASRSDGTQILKYAAELRDGKHSSDALAPLYDESLFGEPALLEYFSCVSPKYASRSNARRFLIQRRMFEAVRGADGVEVHIEPYIVDGTVQESSSWVTIAAANVLPDVLLRLCTAIISARGLDIGRAHLDAVVDPDNSSEQLQGTVSMLRLMVTSLEGTYSLNDKSDFSTTLARDLKRVKWLDNTTTELGLQKFPELGLDKAEVITSLCSLLHGPLAKEDAQAFASIRSVLQVLESHGNYISIASSIASLFLDRFNPHNVAATDSVQQKQQQKQKKQQKDTSSSNSSAVVGKKSALTDAEFQERSDVISSKINMLQNDKAILLLSKMLEATRATLRTNFYREDRYALSLRLDPSILVPPGVADKPQPFGVFFSHGRHFNAFHCRFRDIARGGLRIVTPQNSDQFALESTRQFDEVYSLSFAQQLKNKDIPEGGAKGVILVNTPNIKPQAKQFAMRKAVKAFTDSMFDLMVTDSVQNLVDFYGKEELIYFGPDEQIIPSDIDWIVNRAAVRGYPLPDAVMSSKKDNGINHKDYGVTSEGVVVYLDVALRRILNIDPHKDPFTVKITGGPDGDVAGNLMRILFRDYGSNARVVGVADGFGVAEDPQGLDSAELLRLFQESLPITSFDPSKLSPTGVVLDVNSEDGLLRRNTMHFRVKADAFVPAGGRPNTINGSNWRQFLDEEGHPSSKLIVEGANIFITPEARQKLFEEGNVVIVKDSSANKCGVITSSSEVAASMLLSKAEFMSIKEQLVQDILVHLRHLARLEGELLFREFRNYPGALPHFSERISFAIAKVTDALTDALAEVQPQDALFQELLPLVRSGLPKKLQEVAGDRISSNFPVQYQRNAIAKMLASKLVYKEGIHFVEIQPTDRLAERAIAYYRHDCSIQQLSMSLLAQDAVAMTPETRSLLLDLVNRGGARTKLEVF